MVARLNKKVHVYIMIEITKSKTPLYAIGKWPGVFNIIVFSIYTVVISVCLFVCLSDHNSGTSGPICLKF